jgi:hypothetical protein
MDSTWPHSRLRYIAADKLDSTIDFHGLDVHGPSGHKIGDVDGFIFDAATYRPYYVVVDSGGWFSSRQFLLPIGHAALDDNGRALRTDVEKDAIAKYPAFEKERFGQMSDEELSGFARRTVEACCVKDLTVERAPDAAGPASHELWSHYREPGWWNERFQPSEVGGVAHDEGYVTSRPSADGERRRDDGEWIVARAHVSDVSSEGGSSEYLFPELDGRAQPGDVLDIETGGERTSVEETAEDERRRRDEAETKAADGQTGTGDRDDDGRR